MDEVGVVEFEYQGETYRLPGDLVALQVEIARTDAACRAAVDADDDAALDQARAERARLVVEKYRRAGDWWATFAGGVRWKADWALQAYARLVLEAGVSSSTAT